MGKHYGPNSMKPDVSDEMYKTLAKQHLNQLKEYQKDRANILNNTISQSKSKLWHELRGEMITASHFGATCTMRESTSCSSKVKNIVHQPTMRNSVLTKALQYGSEKEKEALRDLEEQLKINVQPSGSIIDSTDE